MILYGKPVAEQIRKEHVENFAAPKRQRTLTVIADETSDQHYLKAIRSAAVEWDVEIQTATNEREAARRNATRVIDIRREPKVMHGFYGMDGQSPESLLGIYKGQTTALTPCTPEAIVLMLESCYASLEGKTVAILGRSERVGKPLGLMLMHRNCTVATAHSKTPATVRNSLTQMADIVVCATGAKGLIKRYDVKWGTTVVNVGGDYDEDTGHEGINLIPYKGGVGCVTTAVLMRHVVM